ncbi:MAG: PTS sugar transporter subunit IIA [Spirochaetes bacterium]|nr:PTS sugar transporter subunit IIA [Spirochaetota bacterium]
MVRITEFLRPSCIKLEMEANKKKDALLELLNLLQDQRVIDAAQKDHIWKDLIEREKVSSTGIGSGVAIPHKIVPGLQNTVIAVGRKQKGIPFDAIDGQPVTLLFLILGKEGSEAFHLRLLSKLARLLQQGSFREALNRAESPDQILSILRQWEEE